MSILRALKLLLTLRCDESSRLVSESLDRKLTFVEWCAVRLHRIGCVSCRRLLRQLELIRSAARTAGESGGIGGHELPDAARQRIVQAIREQRKIH